MMMSVPRVAIGSLVLCALLACSAQPREQGGSSGAPSDAGNTALGGTAAVSVGGTSGSSGAGNGGGLTGDSGSSGANAGSAGALTNGGAASGGSGLGGGGANSTAGGASGSAGTASGGAEAHAGAGGGSSGAAGAASNYSPCPSNGSACAVLPLGDSITEGFGSSGGGYRVELFRQALQNGKKLTFVGSLENGPSTVQNQTFPKKHEGHGGYTIDSDSAHSGISGSIANQALSNFHPHIVLLMIGTNDINGNVDVANAPKRLGKLIDDITTKQPDTLVVVATIIPIANDGTNQKVQTYNAALPGVVNARATSGKHVALLDNYAAFSKDSSYRTTLMSDNLHPNDAGYVVLGRSMYEAIRAMLQ